MTEYCSNARYVFKLDQDILLNIPRLLRLVRNETSDEHILGRCRSKPHGKPIRNKNSKWYVSESEYPQTRYPPYCYGPSYLTPMRIARDLPRISLDVPLLKSEDVYVGILLTKTSYTVKYKQELGHLSDSAPCASVTMQVAVHRVMDKLTWIRCNMTTF